jgi:hypothetical protein
MDSGVRRSTTSSARFRLISMKRVKAGHFLSELRSPSSRSTVSGPRAHPPPVPTFARRPCSMEPACCSLTFGKNTAARAVQAGTTTAQPKAGDGPIEMLRALQATRCRRTPSERRRAVRCDAMNPNDLPTATGRGSGRSRGSVPPRRRGAAPTARASSAAARDTPLRPARGWTAELPAETVFDGPSQTDRR